MIIACVKSKNTHIKLKKQISKTSIEQKLKNKKKRSNKLLFVTAVCRKCWQKKKLIIWANKNELDNVKIDIECYLLIFKKQTMCL